MDYAECTQHVQHAIAALPGVEAVDVFLASEKAVIKLNPSLVDLPGIRQVWPAPLFGSRRNTMLGGPAAARLG